MAKQFFRILRLFAFISKVPLIVNYSKLVPEIGGLSYAKNEFEFMERFGSSFGLLIYFSDCKNLIRVSLNFKHFWKT